MLPISRRSKRTKGVSAELISGVSSHPHQTSLSAELVAENDDLLTQILVHLPIKSLIRFKCVSKRWLSLITNPYFSIRVGSKPKPVSGLFLPNTFASLPDQNYQFVNLDESANSSSPPFKSLMFADHPTSMFILQSCNGLLLCRCSCHNQFTPNYYVYNPTTKQNTFLPPFKSGSEFIYDVFLAFDPSKSPYYNAISIRRSNDASIDQYQMEIYSSKGGPWRLSGSPFTLPFDMDFKNGVFWNGAVHWLGRSGHFLSYDAEREQVQVHPVIPIPDEDPDTRSSRHFGESRSHLHLVDVYGSRALKLLVYEMGSDYSGWFPKYHVDLEPLAPAFPEIVRRDYNVETSFYDFSVLCVVREEIDEDSYLVLRIPTKAIRYNFRDQTLKKIKDIGPTDGIVEYEDYECMDPCFQFIESLACV